MQPRPERIHNFNAGPAVLAVPVLEVIQDALLSYRQSGLGVMELSHRSTLFAEIINRAEQLLRELLGIDDRYVVLFVTGGATNQFSMLPQNLCPPDLCATYLLSGSWSKKALAEAARFVSTASAGSSEAVGFTTLPGVEAIPENAAYLHFTSNNTIVGTQFRREPTSHGVLLACDASSDLLSRPIDVERYGVVYGGAQKNIGAAGLTLVIVRKDLLDRVPDNLPLMFDYRTYAENESLYNTPPTFSIYVMKEVLEWLSSLGGLSAVEKFNEAKAKLIYDVIDESDFYQGVAAQDARSLMNVTFRTADPKLEPRFIAEAEAAGMVGLKGHRSVGGIRASLYNALPHESAQALAAFMQAFAAKHG